MIPFLVFLLTSVTYSRRLLPIAMDDSLTVTTQEGFIEYALPCSRRIEGD